MKKFILAVGIIVLCISFFTIYRFNQINIKAKKTVEINFNSKNTLTGSLYLPKNNESYNLVIFIHGDGPSDRTLNGAYNFIINRLLKAGYACFSYDKAGIGKSNGNWLEQNMNDRANEIVEAIPKIKEKINIKSIGVLAFSQGGWVCSELALLDAPLDFYIIAGGAIDWMEQHIYFEKQHAKSSNFNEEETDKYLNYIQKSDKFIKNNDYDSYLSFVNTYSYEKPMTKERFNFVYLNYKSNAIAGAKEIKVPFLGIFGDSDNNVDVDNSIKTYEQIFRENGNNNCELILLENANHELLDSKYNQAKDSISYDAFLYGDEIFAKDALNTIVNWLDYNIK